MYNFVAGLLYFILNLIFRFKVQGKENLPTSSGFVIACTHKGWLDVVSLGVALYPRRKIHFMGKKELFKNKISKWFLSSLQCFPVNRENPGPSSLKIPIRLLKNGEVVGIFPSGSRNTREGVPIKRGAVYLSERTGAPIVPAIYIGPPTIFLKNIFKRKTILVKIGEPLYPADIGEKDLLLLLDKRMRELKSEIMNLKNDTFD